MYNNYVPSLEEAVYRPSLSVAIRAMPCALHPSTSRYDTAGPVVPENSIRMLDL